MPIPKIPKSRRSPVALRKKTLVADEIGVPPIREIRPLPAWMQPIQYPSNTERVARSLHPAQSPPEIAPAILDAISPVLVDDEELLQTMGGNVRVALGESSSEGARRLVQTSPATSRTAARSAVPLPYVLPSSTSPDYSEHSDSSEDPTYIPVEKFLPAVVSNQLPVTEPASIAETILSSEGRMSQL